MNEPILTRRSALIVGGQAALAGAFGIRPVPARALFSIDDTAELQAKLDRGGTVTLERGRIYRVSLQPGRDSSAALVLGPDTTLDLSGATLELAPDQRCSLIGKSQDGRLGNIKVVNGIIIGNAKLQPDKYTRFTPTIDFRDCDELAFNNLQMHDTYLYSIYASGNGGRLENISVNGATGGGIWVAGSGWGIDGIGVRNVSYADDINCQGNPFIVSLKDSTVGDIDCENFGFGVKFQNGCQDLTVRSIRAVGGANNNDYLVKI